MKNLKPYQKVIMEKMGKKLIMRPRCNGKPPLIAPKIKSGTIVTYSTPVMKNTLGEIFFNEFDKISAALNETVATKSEKKPDEVK